MESDVRVRVASPDDAQSVLEIYRPYVTDTAVSFEFVVPTADEFRKRISETLERYPYLVAECDGRIVGYAYAGHFKSRPAYDCSVEVTVYIDGKYHRKGIGRALYDSLAIYLRRQNVRLMCACIAYNDDEDEYLNHDSVKFHERMGFKEVARFRSCAYKFGRWYGMVWMVKSIYSDSEPPREFVPRSELI